MKSNLPAALGGRPAFPAGLALSRPILPDLPALTATLGNILASGQLTDGPTVRMLEERVAERLGVSDVVAVSSCTLGLALTLQALGVRGPVVMPSFTFSASAHAVVWAGGSPRFADVDDDSLTVAPESVAARAMDGTDTPTAITATHVYGTPCRTAELASVAHAAGVPLVYDAAHALGSTRQGVPIGGFGNAEVFSLSPTKVVIGGEGGLVSTNDRELAARLRMARNYGHPGDYDCRFPGLNARMSELHAAVALHSFRGLDERLVRRRALVGHFWQHVAGVQGLRGPCVDPGDRSTYKDLTLVVDPARFGMDVTLLRAALASEGIDTRRYFHPAIHAQRAYADVACAPLPVTERLAPRVLTIPLWSQMTVADMLRQADALARIHTHAAAIVARATSGVNGEYRAG